MSASCAMIITSGFFWITDTHASRLESVCQKSFIGYGYKPSLEKQCRPLWNKWSDELKLSFNQK